MMKSGLRSALMLGHGPVAQASRETETFPGGKLSNAKRRRQAKAYVDRIGMPHGNPGDKMRRKILKDTLGIRHHGTLGAMRLPSKFPFSAKRG